MSPERCGTSHDALRERRRPVCDERAAHACDQELSATCRRDRSPAWARGMRNTYHPPAPRERTSEMRASDVGLVRGACGVAALLRLLRWSCVSIVCVSACLGVVRVAAQKRDKYITRREEVARADRWRVRCQQAAWLLNKAVRTSALGRTPSLGLGGQLNCGEPGADPHSAAFQGRYGFLF